jgi:glycosyltransferase involved in cell wall biosynthesis
MSATHRHEPEPPASSRAERFERRRLSLFIYGLGGGGSQRRTLTLAGAFADRGHAVDLVVLDASGPLRDRLPPGIRLVELASGLATRAGRRLGRRLELCLATRALAVYLRCERPDALLSAASHANPFAVRAHHWARVPSALVLRASNHPSGRGAREVRRLYPHADAIIGVSGAVAKEVRRLTALTRDRVTTVYNPIWTPSMLADARAPLDHPWFVPAEPPVVLGVGRLSTQKDFPTLVRAFARVRARRPARLVILGSAKRARRRESLLALARDLGVAEDVWLPGYVENPLRYMARSAVFTLSSAWEGLPGVLIEAMACGCPVVSTDCPGGSREILEDGRWGPLVPPADPEALADAIGEMMSAPPERMALQRRAACFDQEGAVDQYLEVLERAIIGRQSMELRGDPRLRDGSPRCSP